MRRCLAGLVVIGLLTVTPLARADDALPDRSERVIGLARVWAKAKYFHPYLAYKDVDWDAALVVAIPKVEAATTLDQYRTAIQEMLGKLADPVTHVNAPKPAASAAPAVAATDWLTTPSPGVMFVELAPWLAGGFDYVGFNTKGQRVTSELVKSKTKVLVVDLRTTGTTESWWAISAVETFVKSLPVIDDWPLERSVEHHGFRTQEGQSSGGYYSTFVTTGALPPKPAPKEGPAHVVFVVDDRSALPPAAIGLQAAGRATIIAPGPLPEESLVTTTKVAAAGGLTVQLRVGELLWGPPTADVRATGDLRARAVTLAKGLVAKAAAPKPRKFIALPPLRPRNDADYADQPLPSRPLRVLGAIRIWATLEHFFPYRYLVKDWEVALRDTLPKLDAATTAGAYLEALQEMAVRAGDGHIGVRSTLPDAKLRGLPPIVARLVEGKLAITRLLDATVAKQQGFAVGDVIETIDGKPTAAAMAAKRRLVSGSTDDARDQRLAGAVLGGDDNSALKLGIRGADGKLHDATLTRLASNGMLAFAPSTAPHWKTLAGNVGYVDLMSLTVPEVEPMFAALAKTRAIVFDLRGYPNGTAWSIAPRINTRKARHGAQFLQPLVAASTGEEELEDLRIRFFQALPPLPPGAAIYSGKIVVLIDERAISQSEHTCLFFQEAAGATFIGSPTAGANGDVTMLRLPGGLRMSFTGQEVRHVDGKQLQKVGIQPHVAVRPTIAGIRAAKDEVLDRALAWLDKGK